MTRLSNYIRNLWEHFWRILLLPSEEWKNILTEQRFVKSHLLGYFLPLVFLCSLLHLVCDWVNGSGFAFAFGQFLFTIIFYFIFYYLFILLCNSIANRNEGGGGQSQSQSVALLAIYSMTVYFVVDVLLLIMPGKSYLVILCGYAVYLIYTGCRIFGIKLVNSETTTIAIMAVAFLILPILLRLVLKLLLPNM